MPEEKARLFAPDRAHPHETVFVTGHENPARRVEMRPDAIPMAHDPAVVSTGEIDDGHDRWSRRIGPRQDAYSETAIPRQR